MVTFCLWIFSHMHGLTGDTLLSTFPLVSMFLLLCSPIYVYFKSLFTVGTFCLWTFSHIFHALTGDTLLSKPALPLVPTFLLLCFLIYVYLVDFNKIYIRIWNIMARTRTGTSLSLKRSYYYDSRTKAEIKFDKNLLQKLLNYDR